MIKNYFKLGMRNIAKNRLSSSINIAGLALAIGCCLVVFEFFNWSMHMDKFNHKLNNLFVIEKISELDGNTQYWGNSPAPMGPMLMNDFPQVKNSARYSSTGVIYKMGDNVFRESVSFVDKSFYSMFDFPVKWGNKQTFADHDGIVVTSELSEKLFGKINPVNKIINIRFNNGIKETSANFTVKGVFDKQPVESSFYFSALVPYSKLAALGMDKPGDWTHSMDMTFIESDSKDVLNIVNHQSKKYLQLYNAANPDSRITGFNFQPLNAMNFHADKVLNNHFASTATAGYFMLLAIAIATLLLVYFNYMNIAIASASTRLKEIGIRKVMGSSRKQIIIQFILENIILCTIATILGLFLAKFIFLPWFSQIVNVKLGQNMFIDYHTWIALTVLILLSALSGAAYPSFYISAFKPVNIMKGNNKMGSNNRFRKSLLGLQFFLTFLAMSTAISFVLETKQIKAKPWGYDSSNTVAMSIDKSVSFETLKNELKGGSTIRSVTGAVESLGIYTQQLLVKAEGQEHTVKSMSVLPGFITQMGIRITNGRDLSEQFKTDVTSAVLVNHVFMKQMHWTTAVGKNIEYKNNQYSVIGEVNDFHYDDFKIPVGPMVMMGCRPADVNSVYIKTVSGFFINARKEIQNIWKKVSPDLPFSYYYQDTVFNGYFNGFTQVSQIMGAASLIMVVISLTGIFGLGLLILGRKMKEISIRKVIGAGMGTIVYIINKEFLFAIGVALFVGIPFSYWLNGVLFKQIVSESQALFSPLILSFLCLLLMTGLSVSWHIFKAYSANPLKFLKDE